MKIAIIAGRDPDFKNDTDGGSVFLKNFVNELSYLGYNIDVYIPQGVSGGVQNKEKLSDQNEFNTNIGNISVYRFLTQKIEDTYGIRQDEDYFHNRIQLSYRIAEYFEDKKLLAYDLVFVLHVANAFGLVAKDLLPLEKTVLFPMMTSPTYSLFSSVPDKYKEQEKIVFSKIKHVSSPSDDEIKIISLAYGIPKKIFFKTNRGYNDKNFEKSERFGLSPKNTINLFSANGIRPQKNHLFFIPLLKELLKHSIDVRLLLTGNNGHSHHKLYNDYADKFWEEIRANNLEKYIISHGVVSEKDLVSIMGQSDIAVYPSTAETFGKSALESMATGLPTIVPNNIEAYTEFILHEKTGISVELDPTKFSREILKLISEKELYHGISKSGIHKGESFTWKKVVQDFLIELKKRSVVA